MRAHQEEIRPLTGLRGVAALYVLIYHYFPLTENAVPASAALRFLDHGYLAVDAFFVLSGFVMAMTYARHFAGGFTAGAYRLFLGRRIARIYPLYACATLAGLALVATHRLPYERTVPAAAAVAANLVVVQAWGIAPSFDSPAWSLSAEWAAYLIFPALLGWTIFGRLRTAGLLTLACCVAMALLGSLPAAVLPDYLQRDPLNFNGYWLGLPALRCSLEFTLGMLAFRAYGMAAGRRIAANRRIAPLACIAFAILLAMPRSDVAIVVLLPVLILTLTSEQHLPGRFLASPALQLAGTLSFSIYLTHKLLIGVLHAITDHGRAVGWPHAQVIAAAVCLGLTCAIAFGAYHAIELPGRRFLRAKLEAGGSRSDGDLVRERQPELTVRA